MNRRRRILEATLAAVALAGSRTVRAQDPQTLVALGASEPFSFAQLVEEARTRASREFEAPATLPQDILERIDYDAHGRIRYRSSAALFRESGGAFPVTFFHLGRYFRVPVRMFAVEGGAAREILYSPALFDMPADSAARALPRGAGFAGFQVHESRLDPEHAADWPHADWAAFLGASYFRAIGALNQYGLSARGIAIDVAQPGSSEEFPAFTRFYLEAAPEATSADALATNTLRVCALLEGPSVTGAYRFALERTAAVRMDIEAHLFLRRDVGRLGLAPLTSMFWFSQTRKPEAVDWRPAVHDSDGLALWTGAGERLWRPLVNPAHTTASAFLDEHPRGFGLLQRDRDFDHYLDGVHYERRPSLWVEPLQDWGAGSVQLIEIPTDDETHDNIVAMWVPQKPARAGAHFDLRYRLHWVADEPFPPALARCVATREGRGGQPGQERHPLARKFVVEFLGEALAALPAGRVPEAVLSGGGARFTDILVEAVPDDVPGHWRAQFDVLADAPGAVLDLRLYLRVAEQALTETWIFRLAFA